MFLLELFGVSSAEVIEGLEKLRYSLSQGYADAIMELGKEFELLLKPLTQVSALKMHANTPKEELQKSQVNYTGAI